jgi:hypothetical protein
MTNRRIACTLAAVSITASLGAACGGTAAADSAYCKATRQWAVHELTPRDEGDPAGERVYMGEFLAFADEAVKTAPKEVRPDWTMALSAFRATFVPLMEEYGYSIARIEAEATPDEQAALEAPPEAAAAQARVHAYDARVCGSEQPAAAVVAFPGPAATAYCDAVNTFEASMDEVQAGGFQPEAFEGVVRSPGFTEWIEGSKASAPPEIRDDVVTMAAFVQERVLPVLERYDFDVRRLLLDGSAKERAIFQSTDPRVFGAFTRTSAYEEQLCQS